jgi:hypothetical protein
MPDDVTRDGVGQAEPPDFYGLSETNERLPWASVLQVTFAKYTWGNQVIVTLKPQRLQWVTPLYYRAPKPGALRCGPSQAAISGLFGPQHELCCVQSPLRIIAVEGSEYGYLSCVESLLQGFGGVCTPDRRDIDELSCGFDGAVCPKRIAILGAFAGVLGCELIEPEDDA